MSCSSFVHFLTQTTFFSRFSYKSSIVFHQNNFFELRWDYTSNVVSLQCRFFVSIPSISNFQDKVKVARLDLFFLCVFPAFYVGFLLAYWIHFINRFLSIFKWAPENYKNMKTNPLDSENYEDTETFLVFFTGPECMTWNQSYQYK